MAGRRLADRYELEEVVARGGMGVVWRGRDLRLGRAVAVKLVSGAASTDPTTVERFDREARTVARLNHPNIVAVYDFGADGGDSYLVMELVEGRSLAAMIGDGPLSVADAVAVATQACTGLAAAHAAGVVHRDVKPANLIRTSAGVVKICDFGIAHLQHASGQARLTGTAVAMGSTSYMAPEQVNGDPVDARTDLYGLGCTIHAMLTGAPPFVGVTPLSVVHQHVTQSPPDVRAARPDVPPELARLVHDLLAKSPDDRPRDADAVAAAVGRDTPDPRARRGAGARAGGHRSARAAPATVAALGHRGWRRGRAGGDRPGVVVSRHPRQRRRCRGHHAASGLGRGRVRTDPGGRRVAHADADRGTGADDDRANDGAVGAAVAGDRWADANGRPGSTGAAGRSDHRPAPDTRRAGGERPAQAQGGRRPPQAGRRHRPAAGSRRPGYRQEDR